MRILLLTLFLFSCSVVEPMENDNQGPCIQWQTMEQVIRTRMRYPADGYLEETRQVTYYSEYDKAV